LAAGLASAEPPASYGAPSSRYQQQAEPQYGVPAAQQQQQQGYPQQQQGGYGAPQAQQASYDNGGAAYGAPAVQRGQIFRHVYVHAAPDEPVYAENKVIRVPGGGDKHVSFINIYNNILTFLIDLISIYYLYRSILSL
jgi:hypothetical protein